MRIESGPARVVFSGQASTFGGNELTLILELPEDDLAVRLAFDQTPDGEPRVETTATNTGWLLTCTNLDAPDGRGSADPVLLGEVADDLLFLHFRVFRPADTADRVVWFTFFRARKGAVGWRSIG